MQPTCDVQSESSIELGEGFACGGRRLQWNASSPMVEMGGGRGQPLGLTCIACAGREGQDTEKGGGREVAMSEKV